MVRRNVYFSHLECLCVCSTFYALRPGLNVIVKTFASIGVVIGFRGQRCGSKSDVLGMLSWLFPWCMMPLLKQYHMWVLGTKHKSTLLVVACVQHFGKTESFLSADIVQRFPNFSGKLHHHTHARTALVSGTTAVETPFASRGKHRVLHILSPYST